MSHFFPHQLRLQQLRPQETLQGTVPSQPKMEAVRMGRPMVADELAGLVAGSVSWIVMWIVAWTMVWLMGIGAIAPSAQAKPLVCRTVNQQQVCILQIKRSAKNYWEYRATVQIDGERRPQEIYDCRHQRRIQRDGSSEPFQADGAGPIICELLGS
jgi:hypothetical protein